MGDDITERLEQIMQRFNDGKEQILAEAQSRIGELHAAVEEEYDRSVREKLIANADTTEIIYAYRQTEDGFELDCPAATLAQAAAVQALATIYQDIELAEEKPCRFIVKGKTDIARLDDALKEIFSTEPALAQLKYKGIYCLAIPAAELREQPEVYEPEQPIPEEPQYDKIPIPATDDDTWWALHRAAAYIAKIAKDSFLTDAKLAEILTLKGIDKAVETIVKTEFSFEDGELWNTQIEIRVDKEGKIYFNRGDVEQYRERCVVYSEGTPPKFALFHSEAILGIEKAYQTYCEIKNIDINPTTGGLRSAKTAATNELLKRYARYVEFIDTPIFLRSDIQVFADKAIS